MATESVIVNDHGDVREVVQAAPGWQSGYQRYLAGYEQAEDKARYNAEHFAGSAQ